MERLTERNPLWINDEMWLNACEPDDEEIEAIYRRLKDYEDLEEQGRFIKLPCKVGDTIYIISKNNKIILTSVYGFDIRKDYFNIHVKYKNQYGYGYTISSLSSKDISKTWFLTKTEAESNLKM